uniref:MARVEL domain-containing protein n=1 Tax=Loa loa TaxID=7209 RepID=A0A1I7W098_LOALO
MPIMRSVVQPREVVVDNEKSEKEKKLFVYDKDDEFYSAPAFCYLMHYRNAAIFCGVFQILSLIIAVFVFLSNVLKSNGIPIHEVTDLKLEKMDIRIWLSMTLVIFLVFATLTTLLMIYGIVTEKPKYIWPVMAFMHVEVTILIISAIASITSMSMGLQATHRLFGVYISIHKLENHFGPIWPFNLAVLSFFGATIVIWSYIIVRGAYDYLLDKEYFTKKSSIEMVKTIVVNGV